MVKPPALRPSDLVGVVAPASPVQEEFLARGVRELERLGFRTRLGRSLTARSRYTAGDRAARLADFQELWDDPEVSAVFCARGGYGAVHLVEGLDPARLRAHPKVLVGASDVTALLLFFAARVGMVSFHGPMVAQQLARGEAQYDREALKQVLTDRTPPRAFALAEILHPGEAEGVLMGGCLSLVVSLVGTSYLPSFKDAILFLEDALVKPYQIDRMLTQLRLAGCLDGVRGIVFGEMPGCEQAPGQGYRLQDVMADLTRDLRVPVHFGFPSGHATRPVVTLPFGVRARLGEEGLALLEGAVE